MLQPEPVSELASGKGLVDKRLVTLSDSQVLLFRLFVGHPDRTNIDHKLDIEGIVTLDDPPDDTDIRNIESLVLYIVLDNLLHVPLMVSVVLTVVQLKRNASSHVGDGE